MPSHCRREGRSPNRPAKSAANKGVVPTSTAVSPEATDCSAKTTQPLPTKSNKAPTFAPEAQ